MQNSYFNNARILMLSVLLAGGVKPLFASQITNVHENVALLTNNQQKQTVKGTVKDANGEPIIGASV